MYAEKTEARDVSPGRDVHHKHQRTPIRSDLHVITCLFNPVGYSSRWDLYTDFERRMLDAGAKLYTIRAAFGEREHPPKTDHRTHYIDLRVDHQQEIWLKENLLNLALQHVPEDAKYIAFVDADVQFARADWVDATIHSLQHYHVVQMFSQVIDLGPTHMPAKEIGQNVQMSHGWCHVNNQLGDDMYGAAKVAVKTKEGGLIYRHPGFAWAWRRDAVTHVGGLMEHVLLGSADWHMAWALIGRVEETFGPEATSYKRLCLAWQRRAMEHVKGNLGYVDGLLMHYWHGRKSQRGYATRWKIMFDHAYDPDSDLKKDWRGVIRLTDMKPGLRDDVRAYFRARNEDGIEE